MSRRKFTREFKLGAIEQLEAGASMSAVARSRAAASAIQELRYEIFSGKRKSIARWIAETCWGGMHTTAPGLIGSMSFPLPIPRQVARPQSPPPLRQPTLILKEREDLEKGKSIKLQVC